MLKLGPISTQPELTALTFSGGAPSLPLVLRWDEMRRAWPGLSEVAACAWEHRLSIYGQWRTCSLAKLL